MTSIGTGAHSKRTMAWNIVIAAMLLLLGLLAAYLLNYDYPLQSRRVVETGGEDFDPAAFDLGDGFLPFHTLSHGSLELSATMLQESYSLSESIRCRLIFHNHYSETVPMVLTPTRPEAVFRFRLLKIAAKQSPVAIPAAESSGFRFDPRFDSVVAVPPGGGVFLEVALNRIFPLKLPGEYEVYVRYSPDQLINASPNAPGKKIWSSGTREIKVGRFRIVKKKRKAPAGSAIGAAWGENGGAGSGE